MLEKLLVRELNNVRKHELAPILLQELKLKLEAYDDSNFDNSWVAQYEKICPGIITAYSQDHNFTTARSTENNRVVMEALTATTGVKAGIVAAIILLIYKVFRIITNNKSFSSGGSGGRGSATFNQEQNENIRTAGQAAVQEVDKAKENIRVVESNKLNQEDDSPVFQSATRLANTIVPITGDDKDDENPYKKISASDFDALKDSMLSLPTFILAKDDKIFESVLNYYSTLIKITKGNNNKFYNIEMVNQALFKDISQMWDTRPENWVRKINENPLYKKFTDVYVGGLKDTMAELGGPAADDIINAKSVIEIKPKISKLTNAYGTFAAPIKSNLENTDIRTIPLDDAVKNVVESFTGGGESVILNRCYLVGKFNDDFGEMLEEYRSLFEHAGENEMSAAVYSSFLEFEEKVKETDIPQEQKNFVLQYTRNLKEIYNLLTVDILGSLFKFRANTDKVNNFQADCIKKLEAIKLAAEHFNKAADNAADGDF